MPYKKAKEKKSARKSTKDEDSASESGSVVQEEPAVGPKSRSKSQKAPGRPTKEVSTHSVPIHVGLQSQLPPPETFDFTNPAIWPRWIKRFERYRIASELYLKPDRQQISTLLYTLGQESEELFGTFDLGEEEYLEYEDVVAAFESYLGLRKNIVYERAKFLKRRQRAGEPIDAFINDLHKLAANCELGTLKDSLIRDLVVIGVNNQKLSESLQMDESLTLHKAIARVRQAETVAKQQSEIRGESSTGEVGAVGAKQMPIKKPSPDSKTFDCRRCGTNHGPRACPAFKERCAKCKFRGHFAKCCPNGPKGVKEIETDDRDSSNEYLGEIEFSHGGCPSVEVSVSGQPVRFKMDSGADVSVVGKKLAQDLRLEILPTDKVLFGPGRTRLTVEGVCSTTIRYKNKHLREEIYVLPAQNTPLLSRNALLRLELLKFNVNLVDVEALQKQYPKAFQGMGKMKQPYKIMLNEGTRPYAVMSPRRVAVSLHTQVKAELERMVGEGVIEPVTEPTDWCSPIVVVPRKGGRIRLCVDYTKLNQHVKRELLQLPSVEESLAKLEGGKFFSKLDAANGFWQVPLHRDSYKLTSFITPFGRYFFKRLPFGICSGPEVFQFRLSQILGDIPGVVNQADDILIMGKSEEEHDQRVKIVIKRLEENGITLNMDKCHFGVRTVVFLGHVISEQGVSVDPNKTRAILSMKSPNNVSEVRQFLGMVNQLMKFVPNLAALTAPIRCLLKKGTDWTWDEPQRQAFEHLKKAITSGTVLANYNREADTRITADSSSYGLGAVIEQCSGDNIWRPLAYASRTITETESRYAPIEKEALSLTWACEKFSSFVLGRKFQLYTDHKPLVEIMGSKPISDLSARLQRFRLRLQTFDYEVIHIAGKDNCTADCLSRSPEISSIENETETEGFIEEELFIRSIVDALPCSDKRLLEIKNAQKADPEGRELATAILENKWRKNSVFWKYRNELVMEDGLIVKGRRMFIPKAIRKDILAKLHEGHLGIVKCRRRAQESVWWPGCSTEIGAMVENCVVCIEHRQQRKEPLMTTKLPQEPWTYLGADLLKCDQKWYLVVQDYFSRFLELVQISALTSASVIGRLKNIFARHGIPLEIRTDGGSQFTSEEFQKFAQEYGFKTTTSSPHFPQSNGEAENAVAIAKRILLKCPDPNLGLLAYRTTKLESGLSPAELLYGRKLRTTLPSLNDFKVVDGEKIESFRQRNNEIKDREKENFDRSKGVKELQPLAVGGKVWVRDMRMHGTITAKTDYPRSYLVTLRNGTDVRRNRWHLIPVGEEGSNNDRSGDEAEEKRHENSLRRSTRTRKPPSRYQT